MESTGQLDEALNLAENFAQKLEEDGSLTAISAAGVFKEAKERWG